MSSSTSGRWPTTDCTRGEIGKASTTTSGGIPQLQLLRQGGCRGAASSPGGHSRYEDHTRPFSSTKAGTGSRSTSLRQDQYQVTCGPGKGGLSYKQQHGVYSSGAWHPQLTSAPWQLASGRSMPSTTGHQSTTQSVASLTICEEKEEGEAEPSQRGPKRTMTH